MRRQDKLLDLNASCATVFYFPCININGFLRAFIISSFLKIWGGTHSWAISRNYSTHMGESHGTWQEHYRNIFHLKKIIIIYNNIQIKYNSPCILNLGRKMCSFVMKMSMQTKQKTLINLYIFCLSKFFCEMWAGHVLMSFTFIIGLQKRWKDLEGLARGQIHQKGNKRLSWEIIR